MLNLVFLLEDSSINMKHTINFTSSRIKDSLQIKDITILEENYNYGIYKYIKDDNEEIFLECYRLNNNNKYLLNVINIDEDEKNILIELISTDKLFTNHIVLVDSLSNKFIAEEYKNFILFEKHLKQYFALKLLNKYGYKAYEMLDQIKTKDDLIKLPKNIKTNLQKIDINTLIGEIIDKPLGGMEYEVYYDKYKPEDLNELKKILKDEMFLEVKKVLSENKGIITEYRNIICHNRFMNCKKFFEKDCKVIDKLIEELIKYNNEQLNSIFGTDREIYYKRDDSNQDILTFSLKRDEKIRDNKLLLMNILCKLDILYDKDNVICDCVEEDLLIYKSESDGIQVYIKEINKDISIITLSITNDEEKNNYVDIMLKEMDLGEIILLYDSLSTKKAIKLSSSFTVLENLFREYITIFQYIESIKRNNEKDKMPKDLRIGIHGNSINSIYDLDFIELLPIISTPNGGNDIETLRQKLTKSIADNDIENIEFLLNNMLDYNNDLQVIVKHWCELYRYRTIIAHCGIILESDYKYINNFVNSIRLTIENILTDYLFKKANIFKYSNKIVIDNYLVIQKNVSNNKYCDISFFRETQGEKYVSKIENLYLYRMLQVLLTLIDQSNIHNYEHIFSYEYLSDIINNNKEKITQILIKSDFEENLAYILEDMGFSEYADFRVITNQEQLLEEKIGDLLNNIHSKLALLN